VTRGTVTETQGEQGLQMAPLGEVSLVTEQDFRRVDTVTNESEIYLLTLLQQLMKTHHLLAMSQITISWRRGPA